MELPGGAGAGIAAGAGRGPAAAGLPDVPRHVGYDAGRQHHGAERRLRRHGDKPGRFLHPRPATAGRRASHRPAVLHPLQGDQPDRRLPREEPRPSPPGGRLRPVPHPRTAHRDKPAAGRGAQRQCGDPAAWATPDGDAPRLTGGLGHGSHRFPPGAAGRHGRAADLGDVVRDGGAATPGLRHGAGVDEYRPDRPARARGTAPRLRPLRGRHRRPPRVPRDGLLRYDGQRLGQPGRGDQFRAGHPAVARDRPGHRTSGCRWSRRDVTPRASRQR